MRPSAPNRASASSAIRMRSSRVSSRNPWMRRLAERPRPLLVGSAAATSGSASVPTTTISSRSWVTSGSPVNQPAGRRPTNHPRNVASEPAVRLGHGDYIITSLRREATPPDRSGDGLGRRFALVAPPWPEEPPEAVALGRGARRARAGAGRSGSPRCSSPRTIPGPGRVLHRGRHALGLREQVVTQRVVEVAQGRDVRARHHQCVANEERPVIEERNDGPVSSTQCAGTSPAMIEQKTHPASGFRLDSDTAVYPGEV